MKKTSLNPGSPMSNFHLVILKKQYIDAILAGHKVIESRLYKSAVAPVGNINPGDTLLLKVSSGPVCAMAKVAKVKSYENLNPEKIEKLKAKYNLRVLGDDDYWSAKSDSKYAIFAWLDNIRQIEPVSINKKDWRAWVVLREGKDFGLLAKIAQLC